MPQAPTPKRLFVLRHAKSSWNERGLEDHDRPLSPRGGRATELLADHLRAEDIRPALILCSSARRARETLEGAVIEGAGTPGEVRIEPELYGATANELIERLRRVSPGTSSVMLLGHNPGLQALVSTLAARESPAGAGWLDAVGEKFPTGALATLTFTCAWSRLGPGGAELTGFVRPKDLK
jgi:phosphohistidine phosphatase